MLMSPATVAPWLPAAVLLVGFFISWRMERLARPAIRGIKRPSSSLAIHAGLLLVTWSAAMLIVRRPVFVMLFVLTAQLLVLQINNAKYRVLREPFLFSDFGIFSQMISHPRLYLPFFGIGRAALVAVAVVAAIGFGLLIEKPLGNFGVWAAGSFFLGALLLASGGAASSAPLLDPEKDVPRQGLLVSILQYWWREKTIEPQRATSLPFILKPAAPLPDIVIIQSESFFDARRLHHSIRREVLAHFDEACSRAAAYGRLTVPAWGANTMRPEFAFLTGMAPALLDVHQFNPYRLATDQPLRALPAVLREAGYQTTCIHPHTRRFFRRDRAFPNLGFERFVDLRDFHGAHKFGPYTSDESVTDKLLMELQSNRGPNFYFVITMENHGPFNLESVPPKDAADYYTGPPPAGCEDLTVYLRHLRNANRQLGRLWNHLRESARSTILCFYGEHVPSLPTVYDVLGLPDGRTDYFLLNCHKTDGELLHLKVEELPDLILRNLNLE